MVLWGKVSARTLAARVVGVGPPLATPVINIAASLIRRDETGPQIFVTSGRMNAFLHFAILKLFA